MRYDLSHDPAELAYAPRLVDDGAPPAQIAEPLQTVTRTGEATRPEVRDDMDAHRGNRSENALSLVLGAIERCG